MTTGAEWDVLVVGAGPAGSLTARLAALAGLRVRLVDRARFPRGKVCGCCLNPVGLAVLERVGLGDLVSRLGAVPLRSLELRTGPARAQLPLAGVAVSRESLDAALVEAALAAGVVVTLGTAAKLGPVDAEVRSVELSHESGTEMARARVVVAADGLGGSLLGRAGVTSPPPAHARIGAGVVLADTEDRYPPGIVFMACGRAGYLGLVRLEDGRLDMACALDPGTIAGHGPGPVAARLLADARWPVPSGLSDAPWKGTARLTRAPAALGAERVLVVGDAAGYVEPFTGEGMSWALSGAEGLAPLLMTAVQGPWSKTQVSAWDRVHRRRIRDQQGLCGWLAWALRRPRLMGWITRLLGLWPGLARPFLNRLHLDGKESR